MFEEDAGMSPANDVQIDMGEAQKSMDAAFGSTAGEASAGAPSPAEVPGTPAGAPTPTAAPTAAPAGAPAPIVDQYADLPKAWKRDMATYWPHLSPEMRAYVHQRETEAQAGIDKYKGAAEQWDTTLSPFKQYMDANKIDMHQAVTRLGAGELILKFGTPQQKQSYLTSMFQYYGLGQLNFGGAPGAPAPAPLPPEVRELQSRVERFDGFIQQQSAERAGNDITDFGKNPENKYFAEVIGDMTRLVTEGRAKDLPSAYEQAIWLNPNVRAKVIADQVAAAAPAPAPVAPKIVRANGRPAPLVAPKGESVNKSIENDMRETLRAINAR